MYMDCERQLQEARDRLSQSDTYASELRSRVAKLTERNNSSEVSFQAFGENVMLTRKAYVQDLEGKLNSHTAKSDAHSATVADLRRQLVDMKHQNYDLTEHTAQLEARLTGSESRANDLVSQLEGQEQEAKSRETAYHDLEANIVLLDTTKDNKALLEELEATRHRLGELEAQLDTEISSGREKAALLQAVDTEGAAHAELREKLNHLQTSSLTRPNSRGFASSEDGSWNMRPSPTSSKVVAELTPPESPESPRVIVDSPDGEADELRAAVKHLSERCSEAELRYSKAAARVIDLTSQLSEARLVSAEMDDVVPSSSAVPSSSHGDDVSENESTLQTPRGSSPTRSPTRSNVFKRGSMPLIITSGFQTGIRGRDFRTGRGLRDSKRGRWVIIHLS